MKDFHIHIKGGLRGRLRLTTTLSDGTVTKDTGWFDNLITNAGLDQIGAYSAWNTSTASIGQIAYVGTGNTPPAVTDTTLTAYLASSNYLNAGFPSTGSVYVPAGANPAYIYWNFTYTFPAGTATGTLAEVGVGELGPLSTDKLLFSHALIVDGSGSPTTITVRSNEQLNVSYQLQLIINSTLQTGTIVFNGITYNLSWLPANVNFGFNTPQTLSDLGAISSNWPDFSVYNGVIQGITLTPTGTQTGNQSNPSLSTYVAGDYSITATWSGGINDWNLTGGITAILVTSNLGFPYQIGISPAIPKTNFYSMTFTCTFSWNRYP